MEEQTLTLKIAERIEEPGNIVRLRLVDPEGAALPKFEAGAHLDLHLRDGALDLWRQYSLCSDPAETGFYEIGVLLDPKTRGGSSAVHRLAVPGARFEVEGPRNHFPLAEDAERRCCSAAASGSRRCWRWRSVFTRSVAISRCTTARGRGTARHFGQ